MRKLWHDTWVSELRSPDGATVMVADHGAHVLSWMPAGGVEALFLSERSRYGEDDAIRGGVPIIFPQFADRGPGRRHGFARACAWQLDFAGVDQDRAVSRFALTDSDAPRIDWAHPFRLVYEVSARGQELRLSLSVFNTSDYTWDFSAALHTYLRVQEVGEAVLRGLQGMRYLDKVQDDITMVQPEQFLRVADELDRIYLDTADSLTLEDGGREIEVRRQGFSDVVVWNPGIKKSAALVDLAPEEYRSFLCIEAAAVTAPVELAAGATWQGVQTIEIRK